MNWEERLRQRIEQSGSNLCVGLDPRREQIEGSVVDFLKRVVDETAEFAAAFKPNIAYFEAFGAEGYQWLENLLKEMPAEVPVLLDAKRSDIGETQKYYARAYFDHWKVDAITLNPYLGYDSIEPYLGYGDKGLYLLGVTSNPGAREFQLQQVGDTCLFEKVQAMRGRAPAGSASIGLVAGLTNLTPDLLARIADVPLLIPGLGAQGGSLDDLNPGTRSAPLLINSSRSILYGEEGSFADRARKSMEKIQFAISTPLR
ncbi:MAG: orotidine-5'-phosphate decarboxylase [Verrucomicrobiota bacterium]